MRLAHTLAGALLPSGLLLITSLVVGRWALRRLGALDWLEAVALGTTVGLGLVGNGLLALGLLHLLRPAVLLALITGLHVAAGRWWLRGAPAVWTAVRRAPGRVLGTAAGVLLCLAPLATLALYPPTGYDATIYHLPYARAFARTHAVPFLAEVQPPIMPQLQEVLFAASLTLGSDLAPHLLQFASALLVALLLMAWRAGDVPAAARLWAAALWLGTPHVVWMAGAAYVDLGMALQATAAVYAWTRARQATTGGTAWWAVAGACAGFAAATKYLGLFFVVAGLASALSASWRSRRGAPLLAFVAAAVAAAGPWYLRLYVETGNPLFPFFSRWFVGEAWDPARDPVLRNSLPPVLAAPSMWSWDPARVAEAVVFLLRVPWNAVAHREVFSRQAPLTPYYLVVLPLMLPVAAARRATRPLVLLVLAYAAAWLLTFRDLRYLLAVWPMVNLATMSAAVAVLRHRWPALVERPAVVLLVASMLAAPGWFYAGYRQGRQGPLPVTPEARDAYLARSVPGYEAVAWLNQRHGADYTVYALYGARLAYYAKGGFKGGWLGPDRYTEVLRLFADPTALDAMLRRLDADYLLVVTDERPVPVPDTPAWGARFRVACQGPAFRLYRRTGANLPHGSRAL